MIEPLIGLILTNLSTTAVGSQPAPCAEWSATVSAALAAMGGALPPFPSPADPGDKDYLSTQSVADGTIGA